MNTLQPTAIWNFFDQITKIPRASGNEEAIQHYIDCFAEARGLVLRKDAAGNRVIGKTATAGYEHLPTLILQAHMDMVCEKNADVVHHFDTDPIRTVVDGDWVKAVGTTLGADNGIGMAMMLAILDQSDIPHPGLECLFTTDEERGLHGAIALSENLLTGSALINLDSEDDGEIYVGCAGGIGTKALLPWQPVNAPEGCFWFKVTIGGLKGGHSGGDIHLGRANAIHLLAGFIRKLNEATPWWLVQFEGGHLHNAIPREAYAVLAVPYSQKETVRVILNIWQANMEEAYKNIEPQLKFSITSETPGTVVLPTEQAQILMNTLLACPHGVIAMSRDIEGLVETSTNLASVKCIENNTLQIVTSQRSSSETSKEIIASQMAAIFNLAGAKVIQSGGYPGWKPNLQSVLLDKATKTHQHLFGQPAKIKAIHAGLECGMFLEKYPQLDMISMGPQMYDVHSPDERVSIRSTKKTWEWLLGILADKNS